jgi:hypothetical protein
MRGEIAITTTFMYSIRGKCVQSVRELLLIHEIIKSH